MRIFIKYIVCRICYIKPNFQPRIITNYYSKIGNSIIDIDVQTLVAMAKIEWKLTTELIKKNKRSNNMNNHIKYLMSKTAFMMVSGTNLGYRNNYKRYTLLCETDYMKDLSEKMWKIRKNIAKELMNKVKYQII